MFTQVKSFNKATLPNGKILPVAIEQFSSKEFFQNASGWTRNDISQLAATTSKAQYDAIVQRLVENKAQFNLSPDTKLEDAFKVITPRYCQSPNELASFAEYAAGLNLEHVEEMYKSVKEKVVDKVEQSSEEVKSE